MKYSEYGSMRWKITLNDNIADDHGANQDEIENRKSYGVSSVHTILGVEIEETPSARILNGVLTKAKERKWSK